MIRYRNHPRGMAGMSENTTRTSAPVALESIVATGNRSQRRWAKRKLAEQLRQQPKQEQRPADSRRWPDGD